MPDTGPGVSATWIDYRRVRELVSMREVLELLSWQACTRRGPQLRGACPVHGSTSAASRVFSVQLERAVFQCFKCGAHGNQLDLYCAVTGISLYQGVLELCEKLGLEPPAREPRQR